MATIIYKKFFKKSPSHPEPCEHQRPVGNIKDGFIDTRPTDDHYPNGIPLKDAKAIKDPIHSNEVLDGSKCLICKDERSAMNKYRLKLMAGLFLPFLVQSLDTTIIATALPFIASDFRKYSNAPPDFTDIMNRSAFPTELDCIGVQPYFSDIHSILGAILGCLWTVCRNSVRSLQHDHRQYPLFCGTHNSISHASGWTSVPRNRLCRASHQHESHTGR